MKRIMLVTTATISFIFSLSVSVAPTQVEDKVLDLIVLSIMKTIVLTLLTQTKLIMMQME
jgi:hypothetical protein